MTQRATSRRILEEWSPEERRRFWDQHRKNFDRLSNDNEEFPFSPCYIWKGSSQNGYPVVSMGHAQSKPYMHILACEVGCGQLPKPNEVASHLCHRKACINPRHLTPEMTGHNSKRVGCPLYGVVANTDDRQVYLICSHQPKCLRRDTDNCSPDFKIFKKEEIVGSESDEY